MKNREGDNKGMKKESLRSENKNKKERVRLSVDSDRERERSQSKDTMGNREDNQAYKGVNNYNKSNRTTIISSPSENTIYTGTVNRSSEYTDSSDISINMECNTQDLSSLSLNELQGQPNANADLISESLSSIRRKIPPPPEQSDVN